MIAFHCPTCGARLEWPRSGEKVSCPHCGQRILVPTPEPPPPKPAAGNPTVLGSWDDAPPPVRSQGTTPATSPGGTPAATPVSAPPAKGPGEKYCHECGAVIRARAATCPECGVRQSRRRRRREERFDGEPHRGTAILIIGVLSLFIMPLPLGLIAWLWANEDLRKMDAGVMDPEGRGSTQAGKVCGVIATVLCLMSCGVALLYLLVILAFVAGSAPVHHAPPGL